MPEKEDLNIIMRASDILKKSDFEDSFKKVLDLLIKAQKQQGQAIENLERTYNALIDRIKKEHDVSLNDLKIKTNQLFVAEKLNEMSSSQKKLFGSLKDEIKVILDQKLNNLDKEVSIRAKPGPQGQQGFPGRPPTKEEIEI